MQRRDPEKPASQQMRVGEFDAHLRRCKDNQTAATAAKVRQERNVPNFILNADKELKAHAQQALDALKAGKHSIVTAESCTAGTISALLAQAEGASDILHGGFTTYTKVHKTKALGVSERLLKEQGAVNADVVKQLAAGALERSPATIAIAASGVLGPEPDEEGNPVGLVYFCLLAKDKPPTVVKEEFGQKPHDELLEQALHRAFSLIEISVCAQRGSNA